MSRERLDDASIERALAGELDGWARDGDVLVRRYRRRDFRDAVDLIDRIAVAAEAANHHPDLDIRYRKVRVALSTHDEGGITEKDVALATEIEGLAEAAT